MSQKEQIAEVFERFVNDTGYAKANLDDVARELRISKKTIYVHFDGKREIYGFVVERRAAQEQTRLRTLIAGMTSHREQVETLLGFVIGSARAHIAETTADEWLQEYEIAADAFAKANGDLLREVVEQGMAAGEFSDGDAGLVERMIRAMVLEYVVLVNAEPTYDRDDELIGRIVRFIG